MRETFNARVSVLLGVVAKFPDRQSPLEDVLHQVSILSSEIPQIVGLIHRSSLLSHLTAKLWRVFFRSTRASAMH